MTLEEAIEARRSRRKYIGTPIELSVVTEVQREKK